MTPDPGPPPREAVDYLRRKGLRTGYDYREVWREEHSRSFTVAGMMQVDLLTDVQRTISAAMDDGTTAADWKRRMAGELSKRGWWGRIAPPDPDDPQAAAKADLYISRRLDTIWQVNTRQAVQAGVWERGQASTSHPYVLYRVGPSKVHREQHLAWDGVLLRKDDPFWSVATPMNGWGCRCYTRFISRAQHARYIRDGIPEPAQGDAPPKAGKKPVVTDSPALKVRTYKHALTGETHTGFEGIDPGFERNPGVGRAEQLGQQFRRSNRSLALSWDVRPGQPTRQRPDIAPVSDALDMQVTDRTAAQAAESAIEEIDEIHSAGALPRVRVVDAPPGATYLGLFAPSASPDPALGRYVADRIEIRARGPWPGNTISHEIGHLVDFEALGSAGDYASDRPDKPLERLLAEARRTRTVRAIEQARDRALEAERLARQALRQAEQTLLQATGRPMRKAAQRAVQQADQRLRDRKEDTRRVLCLLDPAEILARSYAQYVAWRSGDDGLLGGIDRALRRQDPIDQLRQWPYADFLPLIWRFDTLFERNGWLTRDRIT